MPLAGLFFKKVFNQVRFTLTQQRPLDYIRLTPKWVCSYISSFISFYSIRWICLSSWLYFNVIAGVCGMCHTFQPPIWSRNKSWVRWKEFLLEISLIRTWQCARTWGRRWAVTCHFWNSLCLGGIVVPRLLSLRHCGPAREKIYSTRPLFLPSTLAASDGGKRFIYLANIIV